MCEVWRGRAGEEGSAEAGRGQNEKGGLLSFLGGDEIDDSMSRGVGWTDSGRELGDVLLKCCIVIQTETKRTPFVVAARRRKEEEEGGGRLAAISYFSESEPFIR